MSAASRKVALKLPGWSESEKKKTLRAETILKLDSQQIVKTLTVADVGTLVSKAKDSTVDLSSPQFQLESSSFLQDVPDNIKMYVSSNYVPRETVKGAHRRAETYSDILLPPPFRLILTDSSLAEFGAAKSAAHLSKLKRLELNNNSISAVHLKGLKSLEALSLAQNRVEAIPDFTDQEELEYLDLSGNRITST